MVAHRFLKQASALAAITLIAAGSATMSTGDAVAQGIPQTVPRATCGPGDHPETGLQGQVPAANRAAGFKGFNCNLQLIGQSRGDGANWQTTQFKDSAGHTCAYHGTASPALSRPGRQFMGSRVVDLTDPTKPTTTSALTTTSMLDPWESLKVNERRKLLAADNGQNGGGGPEVDIYDVSQDCRFPQLLASLAVGVADGSTGTPTPVVGHEGAWAPDGLTYYGGDLRNLQYYAVDTTNARAPKLITTWKPGIANVHGMSISDDGTRGYFVSLGAQASTDPAAPALNGLLIYDMTAIQTRQATNNTPVLLGQVLWKDGSVAQHTIPVKINGHSYVIFVDEGGSFGTTSATQFANACRAGMPPFPMARIIDVADERNPPSHRGWLWKSTIQRPAQ